MSPVRGSQTRCSKSKGRNKDDTVGFRLLSTSIVFGRKHGRHLLAATLLAAISPPVMLTEAATTLAAISPPAMLTEAATTATLLLADSSLPAMLTEGATTTTLLLAD